MRRLAHIAVLFACCVLAPNALHAGWTPEEWEDGSTLRFSTIGEDGGTRWSTVWYVVLYGDVYVRLGTAAAQRIETNAKNPYIGVEIGSQHFRDVRADPAPGMAGTVADAMADKYTLDLLFRHMPHPLTARLRAASR